MLSSAARDVVERVRAGDAVCFGELEPAVAAEIRLYRHRLHHTIGDEPLAVVEWRGDVLGSSWPRRHVKTVQDPHFCLRRLSRDQRAAYDDALDALAPAVGEPGMVALVGRRGTGKTLLATVLAQNLEAARSTPESAPNAVYWVTGELFSAQKQWFGSKEGEAPLDRARRSSLLVLDEIQEHQQSDFDASELTQLVDYRYRQCMPTVLLGNPKAGELHKVLGHSIHSRLQETGVLIECEWESFRARSREVG